MDIIQRTDRWDIEEICQFLLYAKNYWVKQYLNIFWWVLKTIFDILPF